jgi:hypothetical protein
MQGIIIKHRLMKKPPDGRDKSGGAGAARSYVAAEADVVMLVGARGHGHPQPVRRSLRADSFDEGDCCRSVAA